METSSFFLLSLLKNRLLFRERPKARTLFASVLSQKITWLTHYLDDARDIGWLVKGQMLEDEIDIKGGSSYKSNHNAAPSHSAFVSTTSGNKKMAYVETSKQSSSYISASPGSNVSHFNSGNVMEDVLHSFVAENKPADPKALLSVDSMVNWSDHEESTDENASQVYGMIAGCDDEDEVVGEFALTGATSQSSEPRPMTCLCFYHLIKDCDFYENTMGVYSVQRESRPMWNNVDNIPPFIPQAAHGRSGNVTFPAGSVNMPAPIPAGRQTGPAPVYAGTPVPAGRQNRPAPISAGRKIGPAPIYAGTPNPASRQNRPAPVHADRPFPAGRRNSVSVSAGWRNSAARPMEDRELLLSPRQVVLGKTVDHICKGDPRTMVDLNNLHGKILFRIHSGWLRVSPGDARVPTGSFTGSYWLTTSYWYALTHDPIILDSLVKQFWSTATLRAPKLGSPAILVHEPMLPAAKPQLFLTAGTILNSTRQELYTIDPLALRIETWTRKQQQNTCPAYAHMRIMLIYEDVEHRTQQTLKLHILERRQHRNSKILQRLANRRTSQNNISIKSGLHTILITSHDVLTPGRGESKKRNGFDEAFTK
ncbi:hypothetical protein Tco_0315752 [Tanacetum coccineum]